jgi:hypothetical protein
MLALCTAAGQSTRRGTHSGYLLQTDNCGEGAQRKPLTSKLIRIIDGGFTKRIGGNWSQTSVTISLTITPGEIDFDQARLAH